MLTLTKEPLVLAGTAADGVLLLLASSAFFALLLLADAWKQLFRYDLTGGHPTTCALRELRQACM